MPFESIQNEKEILNSIALGDEKAFRVLFHEYWDNIYGVALILTKSEAMAEDMVQDIFLKIWQKRERLLNVENIAGYLFIVSRNHIFSELKKSASQIPFREDLIQYFKDAVQSPEQQLLNKESGKLIQKAIEQLPDQQRTVYLLTREQGLSQEQIAVHLGISKNTVRNHMSRALQSMRSYMESHSEGLLMLICLIKTFLPGL